ncbi:hypothetical protein FRB99_006254 [Tulasnella sp. 403]|nr:hypothetical protein FRB99_006254 [Tulasnella sp. 403]
MSNSSASDDASSPSPPNASEPLPTVPRSRGAMLGRGLACARCRKRKQKCDGKQPSCTSCTGALKECEYVTLPKPPRRPRQQTAGEALGEKLARLEREYARLVISSGSSSSSSGLSNPGSVASRSSYSPTPSTNSSAASPGQIFEATGHYHDPLMKAVMVDDMPIEDRNKVIKIFFTGSQRLGCPILPQRFFEQSANPDKSQQPHPALIHAMCLVGLAFTWWTPGYSTARKHDLPPTCPPADVLLAKTRAYLDESLAQVDRVLDYLQASNLLSYFFFQQGRLQEGQFISASNSRMTVMCNLHKISQSVLNEMLPGQEPAPGQSMWDGTLLGRPKDSYELGVRIWTFWQSWYYDAVFSLISGLPLNRNPAKLTTVFPRPSSAYASGWALSLRNTSFDELFENDPPQFSTDPNEPEGASHPLSTYLKGLAILERTNQLLGRVEAGFPLGDNNFSPDILHKLHGSLQCLVQDELRIQSRETLATNPLNKPSACKIYCALAERIVGHVFVNTATIQLCRLSRAVTSTSPPEEKSVALASLRSLELNAARLAVNALRIFAQEVRKLDGRMRGSSPEVTTSVAQEVQEHPCLLLGFLLTSVCMVLVDRIRELNLLGPTPETVTELTDIEADLKLVIATIEHTSTSFPLLKTQLSKINEYRKGTTPLLSDESRVPLWEYERRATLFQN